MANAQYDLIQSSNGNKTVIEITQPCLYTLPGRPDLSIDRHHFNAFKESCPCGSITVYIDSNGDVKYCLFDENVLGNVCDDSFLDIWNSGFLKEVHKERCPLDRSGSDCSSFKQLYSQFNDYHSFMNAYIKGTKEKSPIK